MYFLSRFSDWLAHSGLLTQILIVANIEMRKVREEIKRGLNTVDAIPIESEEEDGVGWTRANSRWVSLVRVNSRWTRCDANSSTCGP